MPRKCSNPNQKLRHSDDRRSRTRSPSRRASAHRSRSPSPRGDDCIPSRSRTRSPRSRSPPENVATEEQLAQAGSDAEAKAEVFDFNGDDFDTNMQKLIECGKITPEAYAEFLEELKEVEQIKNETSRDEMKLNALIALYQKSSMSAEEYAAHEATEETYRRKLTLAQDVFFKTQLHEEPLTADDMAEWDRKWGQVRVVLGNHPVDSQADESGSESDEQEEEEAKVIKPPQANITVVLDEGLNLNQPSKEYVFYPFGFNATPTEEGQKEMDKQMARHGYNEPMSLAAESLMDAAEEGAEEGAEEAEAEAEAEAEEEEDEEADEEAPAPFLICKIGKTQKASNEYTWAYVDEEGTAYPVLEFTDEVYTPCNPWFLYLHVLKEFEGPKTAVDAAKFIVQGLDPIGGKLKARDFDNVFHINKFLKEVKAEVEAKYEAEVEAEVEA